METSMLWGLGLFDVETPVKFAVQLQADSLSVAGMKSMQAPSPLPGFSASLSRFYGLGL